MVDEVVLAIIDPGPVPPYHRSAINRLKRFWPFLWERIDNLVKLRLSQMRPEELEELTRRIPEVARFTPHIIDDRFTRFKKP